MMPRLRGRSSVVALMSAIALLAACSSNKSESPQPQPPQLASLAISVDKPSLAKGTKLGLIAKAQYDDNSVKDVTELGTWSSSDEAILKIVEVAGATPTDCFVSGVAVGSASVKFAFGGKTASAAVAVTPAELVSIAVEPGTASIAKGLTRALKTTGTFTDATTQDVSADATWSSESTAVATVANGLVSAAGEGSTKIRAVVGAKTATATINVTPAELTRISVNEANAQIIEALTKSYTVTGFFTDGSGQAVSATWSSSDEGVAKVAGGVVTAVAPGEAVITASSGGFTASRTVTVVAAQLVSIDVEADAIAVPKGLTTNVKVIAKYDNARTAPVTAEAMLTSSDEAVAVVSAAGVVTAKSVGKATMKAVFGGKEDTLELDVTAAVVKAIELAPATLTIPAGLEKQFAATATLTDDTTKVVTADVTWSASPGDICTISNSAKGLFKGLKAGACTVRAVEPVSGVEKSVEIAVSAAALLSIEISPSAPADLPMGLTQQFQAIGTYSDSTTHDITKAVVWTSSNDTVASIQHMGADAGLASGVTVGTTTIRAEDPTTHIKQQVELAVTAKVIVKLDVSCDPSSVANGYLSFCKAMATWSVPGPATEVTGAMTWSSSDDSVGFVWEASGIIITKKPGTTKISATDPGHGVKSNDFEFTVTDAVLVGIAVAPVNPAYGVMPRWYPIPFQATCSFSDGTSQVCTESVTWSTGDEALAAVSNENAVVTGKAAGDVEVIATKGEVKGKFPLTIADWSLNAIVVKPGAKSLAMGLTQQFSASGRYVDGAGTLMATLPFTTLVTWTTHDWPGASGPVAEVSNAASKQGFLRALTEGTTILRATDPITGRSDEVRVDVTAATLKELVEIAPASVAKYVGETQAFTVSGKFSDDTTSDVSGSLTCVSSDPTVAALVAETNCTFQALAKGSATITASIGAMKKEATFRVYGLEAIAVSPTAATIYKGEPLPAYTLKGTLDDGSTVIDMQLVDAAWSCTLDEIPQLDCSGFGAGVGVWTTTASVGALSSTTTLTVLPAKLLQIVLTAEAPEVAVGQNVAFWARGFYTDGDHGDITTLVRWDSSAPDVATISNDLAWYGVATGQKVGQTEISAIDPETLVHAGMTLTVKPAP